MTVLTEPSPSTSAAPAAMGAALRYAQGTYIAGPNESFHAQYDTRITGTPLNAADASYSGTSLDVTIDTFEAYIGGHWAVSDDATIAEHTVSLAGSTAGQKVYVGVDASASDTILIRTEGDAAWSSADPRTHVWTFDTDSTGVTSATNHRKLGERIDRYNTRYDANRSGTVDEATNATQLGGVGPSKYLRSDVDDTMGAVLGIDPEANGFKQTLGSTSGEQERYAGGDSDLLVVIQGGNGRVAFAWNAYYDNVDGTWRSIAANEAHSLLSMNGHDPGPGGSSGSVVLGTAPPNGTADAAISWNTVVFDESGDLSIGGASVIASPDRDEIRVFEGTSEPAGATHGDWWVDLS